MENLQKSLKNYNRLVKISGVYWNYLQELEVIQSSSEVFKMSGKNLARGSA
jgi:hypothetical protein